MTGRDGAAFGHLPHLRGQLQQPQTVGNSRAGLAHAGCHLILGKTAAVNQRLQPLRFLNGIQILTLQVLNNGDLHGLHIGQFPDHHRHLSQSGDAAGSVSPLTGYQLIPAAGQGPHQKGLQHAVLANTLRQFLQRRFVKGLSGLLFVGHDLL